MSFKRDLRIQVDTLGRLGSASDERLRDVLTAGAVEGRDKARVRIGGIVNLSSAYIGNDLRSTPAVQTRTTVEARISATRRGVLLTRYPHSVLRVANRSKPGTHPAGVAGSIVPGRTYKQPKFFLVPKLRGSGATGVAYRTGRARNDFVVTRGPSVSQAFRLVRDDVAGELQEQMAAQRLQELDELVTQ